MCCVGGMARKPLTSLKVMGSNPTNCARCETLFFNAKQVLPTDPFSIDAVPKATLSTETAI